MLFPYIAVDRFKIEFQLAKVFRTELVDFEFDSYEAVNRTAEKQQVEFEVLSAHLNGIVATNEAEISTKFDQEFLKAFNEAAM